MIPGNTCDGCGLAFQLDPSNTVIYYFENQPWFSFGQTVCPQCRQMARLFWRELRKEFLEYFILNDFGFITEVWADDYTISSYESVYELHLIPEVEITPRHEMEIHNLHVVLENIPDELLMSMFTDTAPPKERPESWT